MYIINRYGVLHSIPDEWALPAGARRAGRTAYGKPFSESDAASSPAPPELGRWRLR